MGKLIDSASNSALKKRVAAAPAARERSFEVDQQAADNEVGHRQSLWQLRTRCKMNFATADIGEHEGRYPFILK